MMASINPFEEYTVEYEKWFERNKYTYRSELLAVKSLLPLKGKGLEIGIGSGRFAKPLNIRFGVDPSVKMSDLADEIGLKTIRGIGENLPVKNEYFNYVLMVTTICFLYDINKTLIEVYRILKNNGNIIIGFIDKNSNLGQLYQKNKHKSVFYKNANFLSVNEVTAYLKNAKFTDFYFCQTIFKPLDEIIREEPVKNGYGLGSFIVIKAKKEI